MTTYTTSKHPTPTSQLLASCRMELILKEWSGMWEAWLEALVLPCLCKQYEFLFGRGVLVISKSANTIICQPWRSHEPNQWPPETTCVTEGCWPDAIGVLPEQEPNSTQIKSNWSQCCYGWSFPVWKTGKNAVSGLDDSNQSTLSLDLFSFPTHCTVPSLPPTCFL